MWLGHHFQDQKIKRSKVKVTGAGACCGGLAHCLFLNTVHHSLPSFNLTHHNCQSFVNCWLHQYQSSVSNWFKPVRSCLETLLRPFLCLGFGPRLRARYQLFGLDRCLGHRSKTDSDKKLSWCWQTRATRLEVSQGHQTLVPFAMYSSFRFLLVCYNNFVPKTHHFQTFDFTSIMS